MKKTGIVIILISLILVQCQNQAFLDDSFYLDLPSHFPPISFPEDNALTKSRVELGRRLFYDTRLSADNTLSCASCHLQRAGFTDQKPLATGIKNRVGKRNAPTLGNVAYQDRLFLEGGVPNLEIQILAPIGDENEFDHDVTVIENDLRADPILNDLSLKAYGKEINIYTITRAIAAFERTLITGNSRYDQFLQGDLELTEEENLGMNLFFSEKLACGTCHSGHNFTDGGFHNIGLYEEYEDEGRFRITNDETDIGKVKTPSLRNVEVTAPYMHNGSIKSLENVIEHFDSGGLGHRNQSEIIVSLNLTDKEKSALIAFFKTLTDHEFLNNPDYGPVK